MTLNKHVIISLLATIVLVVSASKAVAQINYTVPYKIINHSNLAVCIDFTVSCNKGKDNAEAKLVFIKPGETYTIPPPFFNCAVFSRDYEVHVQVAGLFGSKVVNSKTTRSEYGHSDSWFNTHNNSKPQCILQWHCTHTDIW